jgi:predicted RNase H-like HicB family nuclease
MEGYITITFRIDPGEPDEGGYVAYCPELDIASQGDDLNEALENMKDATLTFLASLAEMGQSEAYFKEHDIEIQYKEPTQLNVAVNKGEIVSVLAALVGSRKPAFA